MELGWNEIIYGGLAMTFGLASGLAIAPITGQISIPLAALFSGALAADAADDIAASPWMPNFESQNEPIAAQ